MGEDLTLIAGRCRWIQPRVELLGTSQARPAAATKDIANDLSTL
jgi:hypothetical protein